MEGDEGAKLIFIVDRQGWRGWGGTKERTGKQNKVWNIVARERWGWIKGWEAWEMISGRPSLRQEGGDTRGGGGEQGQGGRKRWAKMNLRRASRHEGTNASGKIITGDTQHRPSRGSNQERRDGPPLTPAPLVCQPLKDPLGWGCRDEELQWGTSNSRGLLAIIRLLKPDRVHLLFLRHKVISNSRPSLDVSFIMVPGRRGRCLAPVCSDVYSILCSFWMR